MYILIELLGVVAMKRVLFVILILIYATISYGCFERKNDVNKEIDELEEIDNIENNKIAKINFIVSAQYLFFKIITIST